MLTPAYPKRTVAPDLPPNRNVRLPVGANEVINFQRVSDFGTIERLGQRIPQSAGMDYDLTFRIPGTTEKYDYTFRPPATWRLDYDFTF